MRFAVGLILSMVAALAQVSASGKVEGRVVSSTGEPLPNVSINIRNTPPLNATTGADGRFAIDAVPPDRYTVRASLDGYVPESSPQLTVRAGETVKVEVTLQRTGSISGRVVGPDGEPVAGASVQALQRVIVGVYTHRTRPATALMNGASASPQGEFRIDGLSPGRYYVIARPPEYSTDAEGKQPVSVLYPDALSFETARAVAVPPEGDAAGVNIRLRDEPRYAVRGKAIVPDGYSPANLALDLGTRGGSIQAFRPRVTPNADGSFEFRGYLPGEYTLITTSTRSGDKSVQPVLDGELLIRVGRGDVDDVEFRPMPPVEITGVALLEDGRPMTFSGKPFVYLTGGTVSQQAELKQDGSFRFAAATALKHEVGIEGLPPGHYLKAARFGGQDVLAQPLDVTYGSGGRLDLVISGKAVVIAGVVRDSKGQAVPGALVPYWREGDATLEAEFTDQTGGFRIDNLPPGRYRLFAVGGLSDFPLLRNAQFRDAFAAETKTVDAKEGTREAIELKLIPRDVAEREAARFP